jgi:MraZ protein
LQRLTGEYDVKLDSKGRFRFPSQLIRQLGGSDNHLFVVNRGFEKHLTLYPKPVWDELTTKLDKLSLFKANQRRFVRYFYRGASEMALDSSDRILLPKGLQEYAGIEKEMVLFAYKDRIELWAKAEYSDMIDDEPDDFSEFAETVTGSMDLDI